MGIIREEGFYTGWYMDDNGGWGDGYWRFDITLEEQAHIDVNTIVQQLHTNSEENIISILKKTIAEGLTAYALALLKEYKGKEKSKERKDRLEKGISALLKAGNLTHEPLPYFHAGQLAEAIGDNQSMIPSAYKHFLLLCKKINIQDADEEITYAKQRLQKWDEELSK